MEENEILIYIRSPDPEKLPTAPIASVEREDPDPSSRAPSGDQARDSASSPNELAASEHPANSRYDGDHRGASHIETESQDGANISPSTTSAHQGDHSDEDVLLQLMRQRLEAVVRHRHNDQDLSGSLALGMGDKLEVREFEDLKVTAGLFAALTMGIKVARIQ